MRRTRPSRPILDEEVRALFDVHDAIADVAIAEAVHQVTVGNADRAAASMDAYGGKSAFPPEPDVVTTPRSGTSLVHRIGLHLRADAVAGAGSNAASEGRAGDRPMAVRRVSAAVGDRRERRIRRTLLRKPHGPDPRHDAGARPSPRRSSLSARPGRHAGDGGARRPDRFPRDHAARSVPGREASRSATRRRSSARRPRSRSLRSSPACGRCSWARAR